MRKSCTSIKKIYSIEEKRSLLAKYSVLVGKNVVLLGVEEANNSSSQRDKIKVCIGTIVDVQWRSFENYVVFDLKLNNSNSIIKVHASRWNYTMFENADDAINVLKRLANGEAFNLHESLDRWMHEFDNLVWVANKDNLISSYTFTNNSELLRFNKNTGVIDVAKVEVFEDEYILRPGQRFDITQIEIYDSEEYNYYTLEQDNGCYIIDQEKDFYKDVKDFINKQLSIINNDSNNHKSTINNDSNEHNSICITEELFEKAIKTAISNKMPDIAKEAMYLIKNNLI